MKLYEKRRIRRDRLIYRIIIVLNIAVLAVCIVLMAKYVIEALVSEKDDDKWQLIASESIDGVYREGVEDTYPVTSTDQQDTETGKDDFNWTADSTDTKKIIELEYMNQADYPTGCESVTTWMALNYMGYELSVDEFIDNYLPKYTTSRSGKIIFGEDPNEYFIGDPRSDDSFGCFAPVIKKALASYIGADAVHDLTGESIDDIIEGYVSKGIPVIMWATIGMNPTTEGQTWYINRTGETYKWVGGEHCLLLAGWDDEKYYFYDPWKNKGIVGYKKELVIQRYTELGMQALAVVKAKDKGTSGS